MVLNHRWKMMGNDYFDVYTIGQTTLNSLQELKATVNLYRKSYKVMIETAKQLKLLGDF